MSKEIRIEMTGHGRGTVFSNGVELKDVQSVSFRFEAGGVNVVTVELFAQLVTVTGPADVTQTRAIIDVTNLSSTSREFRKDG